MKNSTKNLYKALIIASASLTFAMTAQAAGYIKFDGIDGESKRSQQQASQQQSAPKRLINKSTGHQGLLLPAVQSVREAARTSSPQREKNNNNHVAGGEHEIEYDIAK